MDGCRRIVCLCGRSSGLFSRVKTPTNCPGTVSFRGRNHATDAKLKPKPDTGGKPRLRAIDLARKIQQEKAKAPEKEPPMSTEERTVTDLKRFSVQLQNVHPNVLAKHLHRGVLYQDRDVVIVNKPYGVPVREDPRITSVSSVLPAVAKLLDGMKVKSDSRLLTCLALEKDATGALLLARSEEAAECIVALGKQNEVQKKYWVVTVGVPVPSEGLIDIPIVEREVTGPQPHFKMGLSPLFKVNDEGDGVTQIRGQRQAQPAATKYRVLDSSSGCSLVELQPLTGAKHQLRVHMALALGCPILGDHKYSHWNKLAPQKLPERVLGKLGLEQTKSRYLPLHLHARQLNLPGRRNPAGINVSCPLPKYFTQTLNKLLLTPPSKNDDK